MTARAKKELERGEFDAKDAPPLRNDDGNAFHQFKFVYWGPGESGKTTNFYRLGEKFRLIRKNRVFSISTTDGRTLWSDSACFMFKLTVSKRAYSIVVEIVTCTGQERFLATREYVLDGADGVVFVADSSPEKLEENKRSFRELLSFTSNKRVPHVVQLNKRDLENAISVKDFKKALDLPSGEVHSDGSKVLFPAVALEGKNVVPCFKELLAVVFLPFVENLVEIV